MLLHPLLILLFLVSLGDAQLPVTSWSGGHAGIGLNSTEFDIYSVGRADGGVATHFWLTGGNKSNINNAIVTFYVDGIPTITFQPNMAGGTAFTDTQTPCDLGNCPEINSNWGNEWIGKGSGMGGWYVNFRVPFNSTFRATIKSHVSSMRPSQSASECVLTDNTDFYGNDLPGQQIPNINSAGDCCNLCVANPACGAFT